jgi:hypothetical protein
METFLQCLWSGPLASNNPMFFQSLERTAVRICENLRKILIHTLLKNSLTKGSCDMKPNISFKTTICRIYDNFFWGQESIVPQQVKSTERIVSTMYKDVAQYGHE